MAGKQDRQPIVSGEFDDPNFNFWGEIARAISTGQEMVEVEFKRQGQAAGGFVVSAYREPKVSGIQLESIWPDILFTTLLQIVTSSGGESLVGGILRIHGDISEIK